MVAIRKDNRKALSTHFSVDGLKNGEIPCRAPEELIVSVPSQRTMLNRASRSSNVTFMKHCLQGAFRPSNGSAAEDGIHFAAGRAAVKPACRFRQARGLTRGSEYGSSVQSTTPAGDLKSSAGFSRLCP